MSNSVPCAQQNHRALVSARRMCSAFYLFRGRRLQSNHRRIATQVIDVIMQKPSLSSEFLRLNHRAHLNEMYYYFCYDIQPRSVCQSGFPHQLASACKITCKVSASCRVARVLIDFNGTIIFLFDEDAVARSDRKLRSTYIEY
jgi:hypothetical protein